MKKSGCGKKPASKGYRMSRGGGVKRYQRGGETDVGARPAKPSPEVMQAMKQQRSQNAKAKTAGEAQLRNNNSATMSPKEIQSLKAQLKQQLMDKQMREAAAKPPQKRGYSNGGRVAGISPQHKRMLMRKLMGR